MFNTFEREIYSTRQGTALEPQISLSFILKKKTHTKRENIDDTVIQ